MLLTSSLLSAPSAAVACVCCWQLICYKLFWCFCINSCSIVSSAAQTCENITLLLEMLSLGAWLAYVFIKWWKLKTASPTGMKIEYKEWHTLSISAARTQFVVKEVTFCLSHRLLYATMPRCSMATVPGLVFVYMQMYGGIATIEKKRYLQP